MADVGEAGGGLVVGHVEAFITGGRSRRYEPEVRIFEVQNQETNERFTVGIESDDRRFAISLPPGDYRLNRVQINEGPFMSMAQLTAAFSVKSDVVTYLGIWRFGVDSPRYGRMVALSMIQDDGDQSQADTLVRGYYPSVEGRPLVAVIPEPSHIQTRLYEVMPYPRYPRYFQRHVW